MGGPSPYEPPRSQIDASEEKPKPARTVGYLVGGLIQLGLGAFLLLRGILREPPDVSVFGLLLAFLGTAAIARYRARR
jgi:hypothetical protein